MHTFPLLIMINGSIIVKVQDRINYKSNCFYVTTKLNRFYLFRLIINDYEGNLEDDDFD